MTGIALVVGTALAMIALQLSGHGMMGMIDHPPTPPDLAARGVILDHRLTVTTPPSFIAFKWVAIAGLICIATPFVVRRKKMSV